PLEPHPLALLFPKLEADEFADLVADIRANGLQHPIVVFEGKILEGVHRYHACIEAGVEPRFEQYTGSDPYAYVISANIRRRHLNKEQQAKAIVVVEQARATDLAKLARSVPRGEGGRVAGSTTDPVKTAAVAEAAKHGISKRTVERALASGEPIKPPQPEIT